MTKLSEKQVQLAIHKALMTIRDNYVPRRPGTYLMHPEAKVTNNLKYNAVKIEKVGKGEYRVFVDQQVAPYMPYTNEPWVSDAWKSKAHPKGLKNPNEKWWPEFCYRMITEVSSELAKGNLRGLTKK